MEKYKARVQRKNFDNGTLSVTVLFTNGTENILEVFQTNRAQDDNWLDDHIQEYLERINSLPDFFQNLEIDRDVEHVPRQERLAATGGNPTNPKEEYKQDLIKFEKYVSALAKGFTTKESEDFKALKTKLTANFKPDYLDLF